MEAVKWQWFDGAAGLHKLSSVSPELWALFQACDLFRLAYETILSAALVALSDAPRNRLPLTVLVEELVDQAPAKIVVWQLISDRVLKRHL